MMAAEGSKGVRIRLLLSYGGSGSHVLALLLFYKGLDGRLRDNVGAIGCRALFPSAREVPLPDPTLYGRFVNVQATGHFCLGQFFNRGLHNAVMSMGIAQ